MTSLNEWFEEKFKRDLNDSPEWSTILGIKNNYNELDDISAFKKNELLEQYKIDLKELSLFDDDKKNLYYETYKYNLLDKIENNKCINFIYPIDHLDGIHKSFIDFMINFHLINDKNDAWAYVQRLVLFEEKINQTIENIIIRLNKNVGIPPTFVIDYIIDDCNNIIKNNENENLDDNIFTNDIMSKIQHLTNINKKNKKKLKICTTKIVHHIVIPSYKLLVDFLNELKNFSDDVDGVWKFNDPKFYKYMIKHHTTLHNVNPENIYLYGLAEVKRIHKEIYENIMKPLERSQYSIEQFFQEIQNEKIFYLDNTPENKKKILDTFYNYIENIKNNLDSVFITKPKNNIIVKEIEKYRAQTSTDAFYYEGSYNINRPGIFYVNLNNIETFPIYEMESLAYHEGIPGHHLQISIANELNDDVPDFQKHSLYTVYAEGWALYSEYLAKEMGLFTDIFSDLGRLNYELLRSCRLVVDVGIHWKKWTKDFAISYLTKNMIISYDNAKKAVERYIVTPGQALSYKIGMAFILKLRKYAMDKLKNNFDIREFHEVVLKNGSLPLFLLKKNIKLYVESKIKSKIESKIE